MARRKNSAPPKPEPIPMEDWEANQNEQLDEVLPPATLEDKVEDVVTVTRIHRNF